MSKLIEANLVQNIVNYLAKRPYDEVYQIIPALMQLPDETTTVEQEVTTPS